MVNKLHVSRCALPGFLAACLVLSGAAMVAFREGSTKGAAYSYVQPDDATFGVWGLIYALQLVLVAAQLVAVHVAGLEEARAWLALNYVSNGLWLVVNGAANSRGGFSFWLAVVVLWLNLYSLVRAYVALGVDYTTPKHSLAAKLCLFLPVSCNLSWVVLAAVLNAVNTLYDPADASKVAVGGADFAIAVAGLACMLACYLAVTRLDAGYALVAVLYFWGLHRNQQPGASSPLRGSADLDSMAIACCVAVVLSYLLGLSLWICGASRDSGEERLLKGDERLGTIKGAYAAL
jgi:hypothetical protein